MGVILGVDPGSSGFVVALDSESRVFLDSFQLPFFSDGQLDVQSVYSWLKGLTDEYGMVVRCGLESVHAIFGSSAKSTFQFGRVLGSLETMLTAASVSFRPVTPKTWQKLLWAGIKPVHRGGKLDTKAMSFSAVQKLYPEVDFRRTPRCKNFDDNKVDATLIAYYICVAG